MKTMINMIFVAWMIVTAISCKKQDPASMTVIKDCTGVYLRYDGNDYHVCNIEKLASYRDGEIVSAAFRRVEECTGTAKDVVVCFMLHPNEGWIEVERINR